MKRAAIIVLLLLGLPLLVGAPAPAADVVLLLSADLPPYQDAADGVEEALEGLETVRLSLKGRQENWQETALLIEEESPRIVVPLGSLATVLTARRLKGPRLVYSMILNPAQLLAEAQDPDRITGVSMNVDPADVFAAIRRAFPAARKVGTLYDPRRSAEIVEEARLAAASHGLELVAREVRDARQLPAALDQVVRSGVDVFWLFVDRTVLQTREGLELLMLETLREGIPIISPSDRYVKAGALMSLSINYRSLGRQAGELVRESLRASPLLPAPRRPENLDITLNEKVRQALDLQLPPTFRNQVTRTIE